MNFSSILLNWYAENKRDLPWRQTDNPYVIWIAEVVFQQTRIEQGLPYFIKFLEKFESIDDLAIATEDEVLKMWQGLGYYSRARNLHFSAKFIVNELNGNFPSTYDELLKLKGVGPYIAAEIASVCFGSPIAAVDGNVQRVISRYFGVTDAINSTNGSKIIKEIANSQLEINSPGDFNQALMDFGSSICAPKNPKCGECVFMDGCFANRNNLQSEIPYKIRKGKVRKRYFNFIIAVNNGKIALQKRKSGDVWQGLYQPILIESESEIKNFNELSIGENGIVLMAHKRQLSHQTLFLKFWKCETSIEFLKSNKFEWFPLSEISDLPVPKSVEQFFSSKEFSNTYLSSDN